MKKKVLIIGNSGKTYVLAKKLAENHEVYVAPGNDSVKNFATTVDIRRNAHNDILEFVLENNIDMTIPLSKTISGDNLAERFAIHNLPIFAPSSKTSKLLADKISMKKMLYKLKIPTPKFAVFDKQNAMIDYVKNMSVPFVIKTNSDLGTNAFSSFKFAKNYIENLFFDKSIRLLVEEYVYGTPFMFYAITDGFKALPFGTSILYSHSMDGDGGQLTDGMGSCSPNYKLSLKDEKYLMDCVIYPILEYLQTEAGPYIGIIGLNCILTQDNQIKILSYQPFMKDCDCAGILELLDADIYSLFQSCILGSFSDEIDYIPFKDLYSTTVVLSCTNINNKENIIEGIDIPDDNIFVTYYDNAVKNKYLEFEATKGDVIAVTSFASTVTTATNRVYDYIKNINFNGIKYRKDIAQPDAISTFDY